MLCGLVGHTHDIGGLLFYFSPDVSSVDQFSWDKEIRWSILPQQAETTEIQTLVARFRDAKGNPTAKGVLDLNEKGYPRRG